MSALAMQLYKLERKLGHGTLGDVYLTRDPVRRELVALKLMTSAAHDEGLKAHLKSEFRILSKLRHPNLVRVFDFGEKQGRLFFTSEYVAGPEIRKAAQNFNWEEKLELIIQLCHALDYIHARKIVHGDLKPQNILVATDKQQPILKLLDFGLARHMGSHLDGPAGGTLAYMAPEVLMGRLSPRSDLYSLGILMYELLSGHHPIRLREKSAQHRLPPLSDFDSNCPRLLDDIISKLMAADMDERFSRARMVIRALQRCSDRLRDSATVSAPQSSLYVSELIGRQDAYKSCWQAIDNPETSMLIISGPLGSGKSRLLSEIRAAALLQGYHVITANSLLEMFHQLRLTIEPLTYSNDDVSAHQLWIEALQSQLSTKRTLLILDSLDQLNPSDLDFLVHYTRRASALSIPLTWIGELHPEQLKSRQEKLIDKLIQTKDCHRTHLDDFSTREFSDYIQHVTAHENVPIAFAAAVHKVCGGRPLALETALRQLSLKHGNLEDIELNEHLLSSLSAPLNNSNPAQQIYASLTAPQCKLINLIALWQGNAPFTALRALLAWNEDRLIDTAAALLLRGILRQDGISYELAVPVWRQNILDQLSTHSQRHWHRRIAQWIEKQDSSTNDWQLIDVASHYLQAHDKNKGPHYGIKAARWLQNKYFNERARYFYETSLKLGGPAILELDTEEKLAFLYERLGEYELARKHHKSIHKKTAETSSEIHIGLLHQKQGQWDEALALYQRVLKISKRPTQRLQLFSLIAMILVRQGKLNEAWQILQDGLPLSKRRQDAETASYLNTCGLISYYRSHYREAINYYKKCLAIYEAQDAEAGIENVCNNLGMVLAQEHDATDALEYYNRALKIAEKRGHLPFQATLWANKATAFQERGEYKAALQGYSRSAVIHRQLDMTAELCGDSLNLANLYTIFGTHKESQEWIETAESLLQSLQSTSFHAFLASIKGDYALLENDFDKAIQHYQSAESLFRKSESKREQRFMLFNQIKACFMQKNIEQAEQLLMNLAAPSMEDDSESALLYDLLIARLHTYKKLELAAAEDSLSGAAHYLLNYQAPELAWEVQLALYELSLLRGDTEQSRGHLFKAQNIIAKIASQVPEEYQQDYLNHPIRQHVFKLDETQVNIVSAPKENNMAAAQNENPIQLTRLLEINRRLNSQWDLDKLLELIMDSAIELTSAQRGFLILSPSGRLKNFDWRYVETARQFNKESIPEADLELSSSIISQAITQQKVILTSNATDDSRFTKYQSVHRLELNSILVVPLKWEEKVIGALYLDNANCSAAFADDDIPLVEMFAEFAVLALRNSRYFEQLETSRRQALVKSKELQRTVTQQKKEINQIESELRRTQDELPTRYSYDNIIGSSAAMRRVFQLLDKVTDTNIPVIIYGESGTGKELIAKALHFNSSRQNRHFVSENCSAIPEHLLESELFGHIRGAFTGADRNKEGLFQYAHRGTLLLDEIGDMPEKLQPKLLRVLQEKQVRPIGGKAPIPIDVRIIAASHRDLQLMVKQGAFRQDLFYRLNGLIVRLPALRERADDIPLLIHHFLEKYGHQSSPEIESDAMRRLTNYMWPGNVRELEHTIRNAVLFAESGLITEESLEFKEELFRAPGQTTAPVPVFPAQVPPQQELAQISDEKARFVRALQLTRNHKKNAAELLGVSRKTLYNKIEKYGLEEYIRP